MKFSPLRYSRYIYLKIKRDRLSRDNKHYLPTTLAVGIFCGFIIPLFQMILVAMIYPILRKILRRKPFSLSIACLITWITNPLTMPFLYTGYILIGKKFIGNNSNEQINNSNKDLSDLITHNLEAFFFSAVIFSTLSAIIVYFTSLLLVKSKKK